MFSFLRKLNYSVHLSFKRRGLGGFLQNLRVLDSSKCGSAAIITEVDNGGLGLFGISDRGPINHFEGILADGC